MPTQRSDNGVGLVWIGGKPFWALWVYEYTAEGHGPPHRDQRWKVRLPIDDFENSGLREYQRVRLKLPGYDEEDAYFRGRRTNPPFVWLEFGKDVRT